ncbi:MAG: response regulator [Candidatus Eisenbacteria bacterium]|nr:response regulator [Candidatus Latescibacterota bacterium]MBD3303280.1 response regulator [Candidatus Eisenbacteria bacterium]
MGQPTHVLLVEGDPKLRDLYASVLVDDGFRVTTACNFAEALAKNFLHRPEVAILDADAEPNGTETALELTRVNPGVSVVFLTASPYLVGRDFQAWVADALAPKTEDAVGLCRAVRRACGSAGEGGDPDS